MLVAFSYSLRDQDLALKNARWIRELGKNSGHSVLLVKDKEVDPTIHESVKGELSLSFDKVGELEIIGDVWRSWPRSCNLQFSRTARHIEYNLKVPWLWMEADAIPLKPGWLDVLEYEYQRCGKPFMGDFVNVDNVPPHMSGTAIYPADLVLHAGLCLVAEDQAWDCYAAEQILPRMHATKLIEHSWKAPSFTTQDDVDARIRKEAVLYHSSKDGSLVDRLRERKNLGSGVESRHAETCAGSRTTCSDTSVTHIQSETQADNSGSSAPPTQTLNGDNREALVKDTVAILKQLCTAPRYTNRVRKELKLQGVIK